MKMIHITCPCHEKAALPIAPEYSDAGANFELHIFRYGSQRYSLGDVMPTGGSI